MEASTLSDRANLAASLLRMRGESHFPFTHPDYPHGRWLTDEKMAAVETEPDRSQDPFAPGRAGGLRLWETAAAPTPWTDFRTMSPQRVPAFRKTNTTWLNETVPAFYRVGTEVNGEKVRRPQSPAIVDLMTEKWGWRLLEAAHALAHRAEVQLRFKPQGYGLYGSLTINWVARLAAGIKYGLPVDVSCDPPPASPEDAWRSNDGFYRYGISICDSNAFHAPFLRIPCLGRNAPVPDRDICFLACGVYIEPHPKGFTQGTGKWMEVNRWSCSPTMVSFAGWELVDVVMRQQPNVLVNGWSQPEFVIAAPSLMPFDRLSEYIEAGIRARGAAVPDNVRYWNVLDWLRSDSCDELIRSSPPLPCRDCLRINMRAEGAPGKPQCSPPKEKPDKNSKYLTREEREWLEWDGRIDQVFDMIEKAVMYYEARLWGASDAKRRRKDRRHAAKVRKDTITRIESLLKKARRALKGGKPSVAERLMAEIEELKQTLRHSELHEVGQSDIIPSNEKEIEKAQAEKAGASGSDPQTSDASMDA